MNAFNHIDPKITPRRIIFLFCEFMCFYETLYPNEWYKFYFEYNKKPYSTIYMLYK